MNGGIVVKDLSLYYGEERALNHISMEIRPSAVTALIGPSGCGKSSLLRCLNRMNEPVYNVRTEGQVFLDGQDIYSKNTDLAQLRKRVGIVFQKPELFPLSIYDNIAYGPRLHGVKSRKKLDEIVENALQRAAILEEVRGVLKSRALDLSGGQQQRICIARALAVEPEVLLLDEPASALDPVSALKIEELIRDLKKCCTVVLVTHNMQQAARVSDDTAFFLKGELIEFSSTESVFCRPKDRRTEGYVTGHLRP